MSDPKTLSSETIMGLVRAAELLEGRDMDMGLGKTWDTAAHDALCAARAAGLAVPQPEPKPADPEPPRNFAQDLERLINSHSMENASNTPDFILASYLRGCLSNWNQHVTHREQWYGRTVKAPSGEVVA